MNSYRNIAEVCDIRFHYLDSPRCKDCVFYGKACSKVKSKYGIEHPYQYLDIVESREIYRMSHKLKDFKVNEKEKKDD